MNDISIISCSISMSKLFIFINYYIIKLFITYNLIVLFLKYNNESVREIGEVGMFSIVFLILFFLEKYIFVVYSFSLCSKYLLASTNFAKLTIILILVKDYYLKYF